MSTFPAVKTPAINYWGMPQQAPTGVYLFPVLEYKWGNIIGTCIKSDGTCVQNLDYMYMKSLDQ